MKTGTGAALRQRKDGAAKGGKSKNEKSGVEKTGDGKSGEEGGGGGGGGGATGPPSDRLAFVPLRPLSLMDIEQAMQVCCVEPPPPVVSMGIFAIHLFHSVVSNIPIVLPSNKTHTNKTTTDTPSKQTH